MQVGPQEQQAELEVGGEEQQWQMARWAGMLLLLLLEECYIQAILIAGFLSVLHPLPIAPPLLPVTCLPEALTRNISILPTGSPSRCSTGRTCQVSRLASRPAWSSWQGGRIWAVTAAKTPTRLG